jgi:hypothetical protein
MNFWSGIKSIILWSYERGSWQYDILCVVILAFIFLTPNYIFDKRLPTVNAQQQVGQAERTYVPIDEVANSSTTHTRIQDLLSDVVSQRFHRKVSVKRFEIHTDTDGQILGYRVWIN